MAVFIVYTIMMIAPVVLTSEMSIAILVSDGVWWAIAAIAITFAGMLAWYAAALAIFIRSIMEHRAKKCADGTAPHGAAEADRA